MGEILSLMPFIWGAIILITVVISLFSTDIDALWFSVGALISFTISLFKIHIAVQLAAFITLTTLLLFTVGRMVKKYMMIKNISKNSDSLIGKEILILESANDYEKGSGVINDIVWSVTCPTGINVEKGKHAIILAIDGNNLVVKNKE